MNIYRVCSFFNNSSWNLHNSSSKYFNKKYICDVTHPNIIFFTYADQFLNHRLYVIFQNLFWKLGVGSRKNSKQSEDLRRYLGRRLSRVTHIFQDVSENLFLVNENNFYMVSFPTLNIQEDIQCNLPQYSSWSSWWFIISVSKYGWVFHQTKYYIYKNN